jgi:hypothetical protein
MKGPLYFDLEVEFEDVRFLRATALTKGSEVTFVIMIQPGTGRFEVSPQGYPKDFCFLKRISFFRLQKALLPL